MHNSLSSNANLGVSNTSPTNPSSSAGGWKQNNPNLPTGNTGQGVGSSTAGSSSSTMNNPVPCSAAVTSGPSSISLTNTTSMAGGGGGGGSSTVAGEDSDYSDFGQNQASTSNSRSRQKKFLKNFKMLPPEEVVLQRKLT